MNVYTCADHVGHWPVGTASVIVAETELRAYELLRAALVAAGLEDALLRDEKAGEMPSLKLLDTSKAQVIVLRNGNY